MSPLESFVRCIMKATVESLLSCAYQARDFRDMFILGQTIEVHMQGSQLVFAYRKLTIYKDFSQTEIVFSIELVQRSKCRYNNVPVHRRKDTGCVIMDVPGCRD